MKEEALRSDEEWEKVREAKERGGMGVVNGDKVEVEVGAKFMGEDLCMEKSQGTETVCFKYLPLHEDIAWCSRALTARI